MASTQHAFTLFLLSPGSQPFGLLTLADILDCFCRDVVVGTMRFVLVYIMCLSVHV